MDSTNFWRIIEHAKATANGDDERQVQLVTEQLAALPPAEITAFEETLLQLLARSYKQDLWAAAYIINGGCSDDGFDYFRGWLIAQGQQTFEAALRDPGTLIDHIVESSEWDADMEDMLYVARDAYKQATGEGMPEVAYPEFKLQGDDWEEDAVEKMFPALAKKAYARWD